MTADTAARGHQPEVVLVTGMSGAGKTTAARVLEDLDWFVVDNLPAQMIPALLELVGRAEGALPKVAIVTDIRGRGTQRTDLSTAVDEYLHQGVALRVLFLDAGDDMLVRRYESVRRPHPIQGEGTLLDGISAERAVLENLRHRADVVIDTSDLNIHELGREVRSAFADNGGDALRITVLSFGFEYGIPKDADHVADVRFLPNPHWVPHLRPFNGTDSEVADYVLPEAERLPHSSMTTPARWRPRSPGTWTRDVPSRPSHWAARRHRSVAMSKSSPAACARRRRCRPGGPASGPRQ